MKEKLLKYVVGLWALLIPVLLFIVATKDVSAPVVSVEQPKEEAPLGGGDFFFVNPVRSAGATTSVTYLSTTATSTFVFNINGISDYDMNVLFNASTTGTSKLAYKFEFSNNYEENCRIGVVCAGTSDGDWFGEDSFQNNNTITTTHGARTREHEWTPTASGDTDLCGTSCFKRNFNTPDIRAKFVKIHFSTRAANGSIWFELGNKEPSSR